MSPAVFFTKTARLLFPAYRIFQYFCGNCSHNRIYFSCVYWTEGYTAHAGDALGFVRGFAVVGGIAPAGHFVHTDRRKCRSALRLEPCRFQNVSRAVTGNFRDRDCRKLPLKNLPAKCGELLTVSTVWSSGSVLVNNGMLCNC